MDCIEDVLDGFGFILCVKDCGLFVVFGLEDFCLLCIFGFEDC